MADGVNIRIEGLRELDQRLLELKNRTRKTVLERAAKKALAPMRDAAEQNAPIGPTGHLHASFIVSTRLSARQKGFDRGFERSTAQVYLGPKGEHGVWYYAALQEFGWQGHPGRFALTKAYEAHKQGAVVMVGREILAEIEKALRRAR